MPDVVTRRYRYTGPLTSATLADPAGPREITFHPGQEYDLQADDPFVSTRVALQLLELVTDAPTAAAGEPSTDVQPGSERRRGTAASPSKEIR